MDVEDTLHKAGPSKRGPVCQVPGCNTDLSGYKGYHQRYKICEEHFRMPSMVLQGQVVRFCQQCGKFQPIEEFTNDRRSCSVQLALHAGRRRRRHALARAKKLEVLKQRISGSASEDSDGMDEDMDEDEGQSGTGRYGSGARTAGSGKRAGGSAFSSHSTGGTDGRLSGLTVSEVRMLRQLIKSQKEGGQEKCADVAMQSAGSGMLPSPMFMAGAGAPGGPLLQPGSAPPSFLTAPDGMSHQGGLSGAALCLAGQQPGLAPQQLAAGPGVMMMDWAMGSGSEQGVGMAAAAMLSQAGSLPAAMPSSGDSLQTRFHSMVHLPAGPGMGSVSGPTMVLQHGAAPQQLAAPMQLVWGEGGQLQLLQPQPQQQQQQPQLPPPQPLQLEQAHSMASAPAASAATSPAAMAIETANGTTVQPTGGNAPEAAASQGPNSESSCGVNSAPAAVAAGQAVTASEQQQQKDATANGEQGAAAGAAAGAQASQPGMDTSNSRTEQAAAAAGGPQPSSAPAAAAGAQAGAAAGNGASPLLAAVAAASGTGSAAAPSVSAATHSTASRMAMQVAREMQAQMSAFNPLPNNPLAAAMMGAPGPGVALSSAVSLGSGALVSSMGQGVRQLGRVVEILPPGASIPGLPTPPGSAPTMGPAGTTAAAGSAGSLPMLPMQWPGGLPTGGLGSMDSRLHALSLAGSLPAQQLGSGLGSSLGSGFGSGLNSLPELMGGLQAGGNGLPVTLLPAAANGGAPAFNGLQAFVAGAQAPATAAPPSMFQLPAGVAGLQQMQQQMQQQMVSGVQLLPGLGALGSAPGLQVPGSSGLMHLLSAGVAQGAAPAGLQQLQQQLQQQQQQQVAQLGGFSLALQQPQQQQQQQQQQQGLQAAAAAAAAAGGVRVISQDQLQQLLAQGVQVTELRAL